MQNLATLTKAENLNIGDTVDLPDAGETFPIRITWIKRDEYGTRFGGEGIDRPTHSADIDALHSDTFSVVA